MPARFVQNVFLRLRHLFLPGVLLVVATLFCSYLYLFSQNWLLTIIEGSYLGFAYVAWLGVAYFFLCDIGLNRARLTSTIVNGIGSVIGSAAALLPC
ncbi:MAG: hypothetical protein H7Y89_02050 [Steroidobacteraceae bacterium]|nr:hypothetical protein [Steroidobacteraceae bacterium]